MLLVMRMVEERFHRDSEDRPIRESRTPAEFLRAGDIELKTCPYSGTRNGKPMNASALRQTGAHWDEILDALAQLRAAYGSGRELIDLWRISQLGSALPWFHLLRDQPCPPFAAALAKACQGVGIWAQRMIGKVLAERWTPPPLTPQVILELAEASGTLATPHEACAGSERMLLAFFDVLVGNAPRGGVADERAVRFGTHYAAFKQLLWLGSSARRFAIADVAAARPELAEQARALLAQPVEPPDFFIVEPPNLAAVPRTMRALWFRALAQLVAPGAYRELALRVAEACGVAAGPREHYAALDTIARDVLAVAERGIRDALGAEPLAVPDDAALRDRLVIASPRALFAAAG